MMKHKNLVRWALIMVVVFGLITIAYPLIFKPGDKALPAATSPVPEAGAPGAADPATPALPAGEPTLPPQDK